MKIKKYVATLIVGCLAFASVLAQPVAGLNGLFGKHPDVDWTGIASPRSRSLIISGPRIAYRSHRAPPVNKQESWAQCGQWRRLSRPMARTSC